LHLMQFRSTTTSCRETAMHLLFLNNPIYRQFFARRRRSTISHLLIEKL
jgi:hypothetical protein